MLTTCLLGGWSLHEVGSITLLEAIMEEQVSILQRIIGYVVVFVLRHVLRATRLGKVEMLPIGVSLDTAKTYYGEPINIENDKDGTQVYTFDLTFHEVMVTISNERVIGVSYWTCPEDARPAKDLECVLRRYAEGQEWVELDRGYSVVRKDGRRRVNFSAIPAIGVMEVDYPGVREHHSVDKGMKKEEANTTSNASNHTSDATSEPARGAVSSAHQG
jgi:hypothetical protein